MLTNGQIIISNNTIEIYQRDGYIKCGYKIRHRRKKSLVPKTEEQKQDIRKRSRIRTKQNFIRLVNANIGSYCDKHGRPYMPVFLTLTFPKKINDIEEANYELTKFIQRFNLNITQSKFSYLKYIYVIEFHKEGGIHYHILLFNLPYRRDIKKNIKKIWPGFFDIKAIDHIDNIGFYMSKYMTKKTNDPRLDGHKAYSGSIDLKKPLIFRTFGTKALNPIKELLPSQNLQFEATFKENEYCPKTKYQVFSVEKDKKQEILNLLYLAQYKFINLNNIKYLKDL